MFRFLSKTYAKTFGYFWLPCPVCKGHFGGHETGYEAALADDGRAYVVCQKPSCNAEARRQMQAGKGFQTIDLAG